MRYLIISDVHANLEALDAVLAAAPGHDHVLMLGDLVGYGADPNAVIQRIRELPAVTCIRGNHDKVGAGLESTDGFNHLARVAIAWTASALANESRAWLAALPKGPLAVDPLVEICHGAPFDEDVYIFDDLDAVRSLRALTRPLGLFGHTHVPAAYSLSHELRHLRLSKGSSLRVGLDNHTRHLVNCGAVGQPRDGDPRAAFGVVDTEMGSVEVHRIDYDVRRAQDKIIEAGLPEMLAQRLARGR